MKVSVSYEFDDLLNLVNEQTMSEHVLEMLKKQVRDEVAKDIKKNPKIQKAIKEAQDRMIQNILNGKISL